MEDGERMWRSIKKGPYKRPMITDPDNPDNQIPEPIAKMTEANKKQNVTDVKVMNYLLQAIPNDIYNSVDACKDAQKMWERIKRLMHGSEITKQERHSRLMNEFDKFAAKEGESLESVYERMTTLVNVMDRNNVRPIKVSINTKFLNSLQPEGSKYVPLTPSKEKRAAKNHDPLTLVSHSNVYSSQSYASPSFSHSPQPYYVTHPSSVVDYEEDCQGDLQRDAQEDKLTTTMMLLARVITQKFSTPTNNHLYTSSNTKNQVVIHDGRVDIQTKNAGYGRNGNRNAGRQKRNQAANAGNSQVKLIDKKMKDEAGGTLNDEENDFMLDYAYGDKTLEELTAAVIMMAHIQPANDKTRTEPKYDAEAMSEKFICTVHFGNDHFAAITRYGDYAQGNLTICHVYYFEGLGHNLFSIKQFCDGDLEVAFRSNTSCVRNLEGEYLLTGSRDSNLYTISISELAASSPVCLMSKATSIKSWLWHRRLSYLNFGTINHLTKKDLVDGLPKFKYDKDHLCSACEQGYSKKASFPPKLVPCTESKLELLHMDLFGPMKQLASEGNNSGPGCNCLNFQDSLEDSQSIPSKEDLDNLFGPLNSSEEPVANEPTTLVLNENANEPVQEDVAAFDENNFYNPFHTLVIEEDKSSLTYQDPLNMHEFYQKHRSTNLWTKNHTIEQVIGDHSKPVMTRCRLHTDAEICMYTLTVSTTKLKNIKEAMLDHSWIESMQDELNQFKRLDVWELVKRPVGRNIIAVKWLWKNKTDAENTIIRNKSRLVAKGYGQKECIDF
ncbi:integrase, catalytic region, zinc finger, CCHC-type containing protein [Tanacetum coccineum]|uniref:Integrase, catalytic region, zinc finger, CCHC-type containing protein n=1 Tax=Tanacetum coccineum TaxID=301880 RepID=A0ABQ4ZTF5_9ASTR